MISLQQKKDIKLSKRLLITTTQLLFSSFDFKWLTALIVPIYVYHRMIIKPIN